MVTVKLDKIKLTEFHIWRQLGSLYDCPVYPKLISDKPKLAQSKPFFRFHNSKFGNEMKVPFGSGTIWDSRLANLEPSKIFTASLLAWRQNPWTPQPLTRWILVPSAYAVLDIFPYPVYPGRGYSHLNMGPGLTYKRDEIKWMDWRKIMVCRNYLTARQLNLIIRILGRWNRQEKSNMRNHKV